MSHTGVFVCGGLSLSSRSTLREMITDGDHIPTLPPGKAEVEVLSDFLRYLNDCSREYIQEVYPVSGASYWGGEIHYILTHSNDWGTPQQVLMRQAAEGAGLILPSKQNQLWFITEGEASVHLCIDKDLMGDPIRVSHTTFHSRGSEEH